MLRIRALTFDLDDTLWDNRPVMLAAEQALYDWLTTNYPRIGERYTLDEPERRIWETKRPRAGFVTGVNSILTAGSIGDRFNLFSQA